MPSVVVVKYPRNTWIGSAPYVVECTFLCLRPRRSQSRTLSSPPCSAQSRRKQHTMPAHTGIRFNRSTNVHIDKCAQGVIRVPQNFTMIQVWWGAKFENEIMRTSASVLYCLGLTSVLLQFCYFPFLFLVFNGSWETGMIAVVRSGNGVENGTHTPAHLWKCISMDTAKAPVRDGEEALYKSSIVLPNGPRDFKVENSVIVIQSNSNNFETLYDSFSYTRWFCTPVCHQCLPYLIKLRLYASL